MGERTMLKTRLDETTVAAAPGYWSLVAEDGGVVSRVPVIAWRVPSSHREQNEDVIAVTLSGDAGLLAPLVIELPDGRVWLRGDDYYRADVDDWLEEIRDPID